MKMRTKWGVEVDVRDIPVNDLWKTANGYCLSGALVSLLLEPADKSRDAVVVERHVLVRARNFLRIMQPSTFGDALIRELDALLGGPRPCEHPVNNRYPVDREEGEKLVRYFVCGECKQQCKVGLVGEWHKPGEVPNV